MSSLPRSAGCEGQSGRRCSPRLSGHVEATDDRGPRGLGGEGRSFEKTLQVNHLAPFLLTNLLLDLLIASNNTVVHTASRRGASVGEHQPRRSPERRQVQRPRSLRGRERGSLSSGAKTVVSACQDDAHPEPNSRAKVAMTGPTTQTVRLLREPQGYLLQRRDETYRSG